MKLFLHKLTHWEYWPFQIVYIPIYFLWAYYAVRCGSLFFFNACNPTIKNGGFMSESKKEIYDLIPQHYYPKTLLFAENTASDRIRNEVSDSGINYPLICKPDIGLRGSAVCKVHSDSELEHYIAKANFDMLIQEFIPYPNEVGIFYTRFPNETNGRITGIVAKEFLIVTGDGKSTIAQLLKQDPRHQLQLESLRREYGSKLKWVLQNGETRNLVPYGNHARGAKFLDVSNWKTLLLEETIDTICKQVPQFYFGRIDIMYQTFAELERGENFQIVEVNGAGSEPTHIYDPVHSLFFAWKELARHIRYMYKISVQNHKKGVPYLTRKEGIHQYRLHVEQSKKIVNF